MNTYRFVGLKRHPIMLSGDSPESALYTYLDYHPMTRIVTIDRVTENKHGVIVWCKRGEESAYGAYCNTYCDDPHMKGLADKALTMVGSNAPASLWKTRFQLLLNRHGRIRHAKKAIVNTRVHFGQRSRAHWNKSNMSAAVSEFSRTGGKAGV